MFQLGGVKVGLMTRLPSTLTFFKVAPFRIFKVTETSPQSLPFRHLTVPRRVAFNCRKFTLSIKLDDTLIVCWVGKNLEGEVGLVLGLRVILETRKTFITVSPRSFPPR